MLSRSGPASVASSTVARSASGALSATTRIESLTLGTRGSTCAEEELAEGSTAGYGSRLSLERNLQAASARFDEGLDELAGLIAKRMREEIEEARGFEAPEIWEQIRLMTRAGRATQSLRLARGRTLPSTLPDADVKALQLAAGGGLSLPATLHAYRIGHAVCWDGWFEAVDSLDLSTVERRECLRAISRFVVAYDDILMLLLAEEYQREAERANAEPETRRLQLLRSVIEGSTDGVGDLRYDLAGFHIGVIAWGRDAAAALGELADQAGRRLISARADGELIWGWLGGDAPVEGEEWTLLGQFAPPGEGRVALGNDLPGLDGFRRTHRQAGEAHIIGRRVGTLITLYRDVMLEAFALRDEQMAAEFVGSVLGALKGSEERSGQLQETLRAYFASSQNAASTAALLGVHERTVSRRIQSIEQLIGATVNSRRAELELALRLESLILTR